MIKVTEWDWEEAFERHGFGDGDGLNMTSDVRDFIESWLIGGGYTEVLADTDNDGSHNYVVVTIRAIGSGRSNVFDPADFEWQGWLDDDGSDEYRKGLREALESVFPGLVAALDEKCATKQSPYTDEQVGELAAASGDYIEAFHAYMEDCRV